MTTSALTGGFAVCQTRLGAKIHDPKDPGADLGPMFRQVVGTILRLADRYPDHWLPIHGSHDVPAYGFERIIDPPPLEVNTLRLLSEFHAGSLTLADTWRAMLAPATAETVLELAAEAGRLGDQARTKLGHRRRRGVHDGHDRSRWPRPSARSTSRTTSGPGSSTTWSSRRATRSASLETLVAALVPDLLRAGRQLRHREPRRDDRPRPRTASSARPASSSCSSRISSSAGARPAAARMKREVEAPLPGPHPHPGRQPDDRRGAGPPRRGHARPRHGELSALGIVEVPEGMPLSEGATRARHARRLLQRVLDYAPDGTTIHPLVRIGRHAAEGIVEASAEQEADLIIFGWGGKAGRRATRPVRRSSPRPSTRSSATRRATSPSSSSAARATIKRVLVPVRGGPHAELALRYADAIARHHDATVVVLHLVPPGITMAVRAQAEHALAAFIKQHLQGPRRGAPARGAERPQRHPARGREGRPRRHGRLGQCRRRERRRRYLFGALPGGDRRPGQADGRRRQDARADRARDLRPRWRRGPRPSPPPTAPPRRPAPSRPGSSAGSANRTSTTPSSPTCAGSSTLKEKQGVTVSLVLPTLNEEETIGPIVRRRDARDGRARAAARRGPRHRFRVDRPDPRDRRGRGRPRRPASRRAAALRLVRRARARRSGSRCTRPPATSSSGPTRT